jgi:dihydrofolate reductase
MDTSKTKTAVSIGVHHLYGRAMYEVMTYWETALTIPDQLEVENDFARIWQNADKIVYSNTLTAASTNNTRIKPIFTPDAVRILKDTAAQDISIGGAHVAAQAFHAGLIDECHLIIRPIILGGGKPALPKNLRLDLKLVNEQRFDGDVVHLHYRVQA